MLTITLQLPATASHFTFRNIPTCVGKTLKPTVFESVFQKHPHLRGENWRVLPQDRTSWRNIPTCVGKTTPSPTAPKSFTETSPPAWGKPQTQRIHREVAGNIPTCVGKTTVRGVHCSPLKKHPHLRGENVGIWVNHFLPLETSPPAWGKHLAEVDTRRYSRNIPTCVGKTPVALGIRDEIKKHPHLRGENHQIFRCLVLKLETSPPAWGKPSPYSRRPLPTRIIPTCVGKTKTPEKASLSKRKHPHLRGENCRRSSTTCRCSETSPPAWGKQQDVVLTAILDTTFC